MSRQPSNQKSNTLRRYLNDVREYIERCFGVDNPEARYTRQTSKCEKINMWQEKNQISDSQRIRTEVTLELATSFSLNANRATDKIHPCAKSVNSTQSTMCVKTFCVEEMLPSLVL